MKITKISVKQEHVLSNKLRVAAYARVSTASEAQEESLSVQKEHYENLIKSNNSWEFVGLFYDEAISGTGTEKRDGLNKMLKACEDGKIDRILVKSISRFSRNSVRTLEMVRELTKLRVSIFFEKENIDSAGMQSEILLAALSAFAEHESRSISQNVNWGIKKRFEDGTFIYASPAFGYKNQNGKTVIDEQKADVVKKMFKLSHDGNGSAKIAKHLNELGITTSKGKKWSSSTVSDILTNINYTGDLLLQKGYTDENYKRKTNRGEKQMYLVKGHHEAIIEKEFFDEVQVGIENRRVLSGIAKGEGAHGSQTELSGKIICGNCDSTFKKFYSKTLNERFAAWRCSGREDDVNSCSILAIKDEAIKCAILKSALKLQKYYRSVLNPFLSSLEKEIDASTLVEIENLENEIAKTNDEMSTLISLMTNNLIETQIFHQERVVLEVKTSDLLKRLKAANNKDSEKSNKVLQTESLVQTLSKKGAIDIDMFIKQHIDSILISDRNNILIKMKCGLDFKERIDRPW